MDFGAFVDIGVKTDGLLHKNQIRKITTGLAVGQVIDVVVASVDSERDRIALELPE